MSTLPAVESAATLAAKRLRAALNVSVSDAVDSRWVEVDCYDLHPVLERLVELEAGEVTTEWGVRYPDPPDKVEVTSEYALPDAEYDNVDRFPDESAARAEVQDYADEVPVLVSRRVGPWTEVSS